MKISTSQFTLGLIAAAVVSLTACGGGGGGTAGVDTTAVTTTVMDGLILNALVCVDSNNDGVCQANETQGRTDKDGKVTLQIATTEFATAKLIAMVGTDATDMDFPDVKVPVAYVLRTSAGKHSVISPLTDMVQTKMDLDHTKTFEQAENEVKTEKGLDLSVSVTVNFVANRDKDAYKKASDRAREHVLEIQKSKEELSKLECKHHDDDSDKDSDDDRIRKMLSSNSPNASLDLDNDAEVKMACSVSSTTTQCDLKKKDKIKPVKLSCPGPTPAAQTITFASPGNLTIGMAVPALGATSTSGLAVTLASTTPSVCTVNGTVLTLVAAGACTVSANQTGNASFAAAAAVLRTFTVAAAPPVGGTPAAQTITFASPGNLTMGTATPALGATSTSGLVVSLAATTPSVCTVNGTVLTLVAAGSCSVSANQAGNASFAAAAQVLRTFTVAPAAPVVVTSAMNGKALYAANSCGGCHGTPPSTMNVLNGANSPITISSAISGNVGGMGRYNGKFSSQDVNDLAAYLTTPNI